MAGKLKPVKSNPVQFFSPLQYNRNPTHQPERDFKYKYDKSYEAKANKEDSYKISPELSEIQHTRVFSINDGILFYTFTNKETMKTYCSNQKLHFRKWQDLVAVAGRRSRNMGLY